MQIVTINIPQIPLKERHDCYVGGQLGKRRNIKYSLKILVFSDLNCNCKLGKLGSYPPMPKIRQQLGLVRPRIRFKYASLPPHCTGPSLLTGFSWLCFTVVIYSSKTIITGNCGLRQEKWAALKEGGKLSPRKQHNYCKRSKSSVLSFCQNSKRKNIGATYLILSRPVPSRPIPSHLSSPRPIL